MTPNKRKNLLWGLVFLAAAFFMAAQVGFWNDITHVQLQDVGAYEGWSNYIVEHHSLPTENTWQYPPGAAFLMLIPRLGGDFGRSFVMLMSLFYLAGVIITAFLARREERETGIWVWLLAMPLLYVLPVLRFDLVPTVFAMGALAVIHRRPRWFGALVGIGAMVKVWPILLLFGEWDRRRLLRTLLATIAVCALIFGCSAVLFGKQTGFLSNQDARGLQVEAVAATPWLLRQVVTGKLPEVVGEFGTNQIASDSASTVATGLTWVSVLLLVAAAAWWALRERRIRRGAIELGDDTVSRDFAFAVVLWFVVVSRVLSPQYLIWLVGLAAIVLSARRTRVERPAWIVIGTVILTTGLFQSPADVVIRNVALLYAALESGWTMVRLVSRTDKVEVDGADRGGAGLAGAPDL